MGGGQNLVQSVEEQGKSILVPENPRGEVDFRARQQGLPQMMIESAAADDIVLQIQEGQAGIDAAVEIRVDLKGQNPIAAAGVQKGVNLVAVDYIEVAGA